MKCWNLSFSSTMSKISKINFLCRTLSKLWCRDPLRPLPSFLQHSWDHLYFFVKFRWNGKMTCWGQGSGQEHGEAGTTRLLPWRESSQTRRWKQPSKWNICSIGKSNVMLCSWDSNGLLWLVPCLCNWTIDQTMNNIPQVVVSHVPRKWCGHIGCTKKRTVVWVHIRCTKKI